MSFNPSQLGINDLNSASPSNTVFYKERGLVSVISDGIPAPASANVRAAEKQDYNFTFSYRAGSNTQSPESAQGRNCGIFANGVVFRTIMTAKQLPRSSSKAPQGLNFDVAFFRDVFDVDHADGVVIGNAYTYISGKFLYDSWINSNFTSRNQYFRNSNYNGDNFRHSDGHSKILGFAFDGHPIYGPYGYESVFDSSLGVKILKSGYRVRPNDKHRPAGWKYSNSILINGVSRVLDAGTFVEDYEYKNSKGDLDKFNGRYTVTPDFPNGTYAYFLTVDDRMTPEFPYITGPETRQTRIFFETQDSSIQISGNDDTARRLWNVASGERLSTLVERRVVDLLLPINTLDRLNISLISGQLPAGLRLEDNKIVGTVFEVAYNKTATFVLRAEYKDHFEDRTFEIAVTGPDSPNWLTNEGLLPVGNSDNLFILDSAMIDFQLVASDRDMPAGNELEYFIAEGDGTLPPGIELSSDGRISGIVEPLLSLDQNASGGYDSYPYGGVPIDYGVLSSSGFSTYYYDTQDYDYNDTTVTPKKLNRYYPFTVTVTDGDSFVKRDFKIYVVGDDYLRADNTLMQSSSGLFTADSSNIRTPKWITPRDLGFKRADNYVTLCLEVIDNPTLEGTIIYTLADLNNDSTTSKLPPGLELDKNSGLITGYVPYQPAITRDYSFTVEATRITSDLENVEVFANFYEDILLGNTSFKVYKIDLTGDVDDINDLEQLIGREILLANRLCRVVSVDNSNEDYDVIKIDETLTPEVSLILSRTANSPQDYIMVSRLTGANKEKYNKRTIRFTDDESYTIDDITPYLELRVRERDGESSKILPSIITEQSEIDENSSTSEIAQATKEELERQFKNKVYITTVSSSDWRILMPSASKSRNLQGMETFFSSSSDTTDVDVRILRDNEDRVQFDKNLLRQLNQGRNIGISLFKDDFFSKNITVASTDETVIPSSRKTFDLRIIGEIDSNISWITPAELGEINANYTSTLNVIAETTVPDTKMVYTLVDGRLPNGMHLNLNGEIAGFARQYKDDEGKGLTTFDQKQVSWDGLNPGETTFDRVFEFTVEAKDRFGFTAITRTFKLRVLDLDDTEYTNVYMQPMLPLDQREYYNDFISDPSIFEPSKIYRSSDPAFGIQESMDMLVYAGVEATEIEKFVTAAAKNHKRKQYILGDFKTAVAEDPDTRETVYEVVYIPVIDPAESSKGKTNSSFRIKNKERITVDSILYNAKDDNTKHNLGFDALPIYGRSGLVKFVFENNDHLVVETRDSNHYVSSDNNNLEVEIRDSDSLTVSLQMSDSEPYRIRPTPANTIKVDSDAIKVSQSNDVIRYRSSIEHMRSNIRDVGNTERNFLPLWMRTPQDSLQELGYVSAIPVCYCNPGESSKILENIQQSGFDVSKINYDIDRYIVKETINYRSPKYIVFANYQFNV